jgi:trimethylamine:corrinoid methyltransferase-like protein
VWQRALEVYEPPAMDPAAAEALEAFVARRREALKDVDH